MESSVLLFSCVLSTLVANAFSLSCSVCSGIDEKTCIGDMMECPTDSDACMATSSSYTVAGQELKQYRRTCEKRSLCAQKESSTFSDAAVKMSSTCCFTSKCVPPTPVLPQTKTEKNGVSCMECQGSEEKPCTSSTYRDCTGEEKACVSLIVKTTPMSLVASRRGCGTQGLCSKPNWDIKIGDIEQKMTFMCSSGNKILQHRLLWLIFAPMLLVKLIG